MQTVKVTLLFLMCFLLLAGCGLKGPLYLAEETPVTDPAISEEAEPLTDAADTEEEAEKKDSDQG